MNTQQHSLLNHKLIVQSCARKYLVLNKLSSEPRLKFLIIQMFFFVKIMTVFMLVRLGTTPAITYWQTMQTMCDTYTHTQRQRKSMETAKLTHFKYYCLWHPSNNININWKTRRRRKRRGRISVLKSINQHITYFKNRYGYTFDICNHNNYGLVVLISH